MEQESYPSCRRRSRDVAYPPQGKNYSTCALLLNLPLIITLDDETYFSSL